LPSMFSVFPAAIDRHDFGHENRQHSRHISQ